MSDDIRKALEALDEVQGYHNRESVGFHKCEVIRAALSQPQAAQPAPQETHVIGAIRPGRHLTRDGRSVYIASRASVDRHGSPNPYPWLVECGGSGWSVDDAGRHMQNGASGFDIVARADATPPTEPQAAQPAPADVLATLRAALRDGNFNATSIEPAALNRAADWLLATPLTEPVPAVVEQLRDALQEARNGLLWYRDTYPESYDGSDDEAMARIDAALVAAMEPAPQAEPGETP